MVELVNEELQLIYNLFNKNEYNTIAVRSFSVKKIKLFEVMARVVKELGRIQLLILEKESIKRSRFRFWKTASEVDNQAVVELEKKRYQGQLDNLRDLFEEFKKTLDAQAYFFNTELFQEKDEEKYLDKLFERAKTLNNPHLISLLNKEKEYVLTVFKKELELKKILENEYESYHRLVNVNSVEAPLVFFKRNNTGSLPEEYKDSFKNYIKTIFLSNLNKTKNECYQEKKLCSQIKRALVHLARKVRGIKRQFRKGSEKLSEVYDPEIISGLPEQVMKDIQHEKDKVEVVRKYLNQQKSIRNGLDPKTLIAVHITEWLPNGILRTKGQAHLDKNITYVPRESIHFSFNGPIEDLGDAEIGTGKWAHKRFAILIPAELIWDRFVAIGHNDSWIIGNLKLPSGTEVIVPYDESRSKKVLDLYKKRFGNVKIIFRKPGQGIKEAVNERINQLGYSSMYTPWKAGWKGNNPESAEALKILSETADNEKVFSGFRWLAESIGKSFEQHDQSFWGGLEHVCGFLSEILKYGVLKIYILSLRKRYQYTSYLEDPQKPFTPENFKKVHHFLEWKKEKIDLCDDKIKEIKSNYLPKTKSPEEKAAYQRMIDFFELAKKKLEEFPDEINLRDDTKIFEAAKKEGLI